MDFTSNGRPNQVYHWNLPSTTPSEIWPGAVAPAIPALPPLPLIPGMVNEPSIPPVVNSPPFIPPIAGAAQIPVNEIPFDPPQVESENPYAPPSPPSSILDDPSVNYEQISTTKKPTTTSPSSELMNNPSKPQHQKEPQANENFSSNKITVTPNKIPGDKKKQWLTIGKEKGMYIYNGKPSSIYIWRPKPQINPSKYKHPMFSHFNYWACAVICLSDSLYINNKNADSKHVIYNRFN